MLSPAQTWAAFEDLDIVIDTPYYMTQSAPEGFTWENPGYTLHLAALPEGELTFTLSAEAEPKLPEEKSYIVMLFGFGIGLLLGRMYFRNKKIRE